MKRLLRSIPFFLAAMVLMPTLTVAQSAGCPDHIGGYGPYDYTDPVQRSAHLGVVEQFHFTPQVESLVRGQSGIIGSDLDYTIRAFPNHHRALNALSKLSEKTKSARPRGLNCTVEGYFERGIRFNPKDATLHMLYGLHLQRWHKMEQAKKHFDLAGELVTLDDTNVLYNLGLVYADLKEWDKASDYAQKAYAGGFTLPGLKNKLVKAGKWKEPKPVEAPVEKKEEPVDSIKPAVEAPPPEIK